MSASWLVAGLRWLDGPTVRSEAVLLLRPPTRLSAITPETLWCWALLSPGSASVHGSGRLATIAAAHAPPALPSVALVVPGEDVLMIDLQLPPGSAARAEAAAPFLVEDYLLEDLDAVHIVLAARGAGTTRRAAAINAATLGRVLEGLADSGLPAAAAWTDHELLAAGRKAPCAFTDGERWLFGAQGVAGFAGPAEVASHWTRSTGLSPDATHGDVSGVRFFDALVWPDAGREAVELLQGRFEPLQRKAARARARLQWLAAACLLPLLVATSSCTLGAWHVRQAEALRREARTLLAERRPEFARVPDIALALEAESRHAAEVARPDAPGIEALLGPLGVALGRVAPQSRPRITGLRYQRSRGYLDVLLDARDVPELEALRAALEATGTPARLASASQVGERFDGRLRVGHETP